MAPEPQVPNATAVGQDFLDGTLVLWTSLVVLGHKGLLRHSLLEAKRESKR